MERETNTMRIYKVLRRRGRINSIEAIKYGGLRVAARINDLKRKGAFILSIESPKRDGSVDWELIRGLEAERN